jgi:hypothetical protein
LHIGSEHTMDTADIGDTQSCASDDASSKTPKSKRRAPGRPSRLRAETITAICAGVRNGMPVEHAAATAGVPPSTFHSWMAIGRELEETHRDKSAFTERQRRCVELLAAVRRAEGDSLERLQAIAAEAATAHRVCKTVISQTQRLDKNGEPKWCESRRYEITEGPHIGAVLELLKHRSLEFSQWARKQQTEQTALEDRQMGERLARNLQAFKRSTMAEEDDGCDTAATTGRGPATTDDDSDYEYAAWTWTLRGVSTNPYDDSTIDIRDDLD